MATVVRAAVNELDLQRATADASGNITVLVHGALLVPGDLAHPVDFTIPILTTDTAAQIDNKITTAMVNEAIAEGFTLARTDVKIMFVFRAGN